MTCSYLLLSDRSFHVLVCNTGSSRLCWWRRCWSCWTSTQDDGTEAVNLGINVTNSVSWTKDSRHAIVTGSSGSRATAAIVMRSSTCYCISENPFLIHTTFWLCVKLHMRCCKLLPHCKRLTAHTYAIRILPTALHSECACINKLCIQDYLKYYM